MCNHEKADSGCTCSCGCHGDTWRRFRTRDEKRARLEEYREELRKELQAIEERIKDLHGQA